VASATFLPWYDEATQGRGLIHTGLAYSWRDANDNQVRFSQRPESHICDRVVDTGLFAADDYQLLGVEAALVYGPLSIQSEYFNTWVNQLAGADANFQGVYGYVSYFLTGEARNYKRTAGVFDRVRPFENFFRVRDADGYMQMGKGAWEVAYRYSYLDLDDAGISGGLASDHTIGLNWYLNPYTRLMWDYVNSNVTRGGTTGNINILQMRCQIDF